MNDTSFVPIIKLMNIDFPHLKKRVGYNIWKYLNQQNQLRKDKYISYFRGGIFVRGQYWKTWKNVKIVGILQYALSTALVLLPLPYVFYLEKKFFTLLVIRF